MKTLLTPGCHFGRHTPTLTIVWFHFTLFHTLSQSHPSFIPVFTSIIPFLPSSPHFYYASKVGNIYSCIKFPFINFKLDRWEWFDLGLFSVFLAVLIILLLLFETCPDWLKGNKSTLGWRKRKRCQRRTEIGDAPGVGMLER